MAALLSNEVNNTDKIAVFVAECHRMGIEILPPNLNKSLLRFAPETTGGGALAIRYGLAAIKNVGEAAMASAIREREPAAQAFTYSARIESGRATRVGCAGAAALALSAPAAAAVPLAPEAGAGSPDPQAVTSRTEAPRPLRRMARDERVTRDDTQCSSGMMTSGRPRCARLMV
jgi:hypothetical protein